MLEHRNVYNMIPFADTILLLALDGYLKTFTVVVLVGSTRCVA